MNADSNKPPRQTDLSVGSKWVFDGPLIEIDGIESGRIVSARIEATGDVYRVLVKAPSAIPSLKAQRGPRAIPNAGSFIVERPLDLVQIDHTRINIMVLSNDRQYVFGRPWPAPATSRHFLAASEVLP